jgi:UDP-N-acetylglucosamine 2-epimerase (non-hydrolysing)
MKIMTILGTRPEIIRLSRIIEKIDQFCEHILVHTGQNYDPLLTQIFFKELELRDPDYCMDAHGSFGKQLAKIIQKTEELILNQKPDRVLILGDTNSALSALMAKRYKIPVFHMEAGNRCYDDRVPEEVNRRVIDHASDILLPYTERSRQNLIKEGIPGDRIYVTGNPINEVINHFEAQISQSRILNDLKIKKGSYFLVSLHRAENIDYHARLRQFINAFTVLQKEYGLPLIISTHPHTQKRIMECDIQVENTSIRFLPPFGFFDFICLEKNAYCVLSDSGTVQEECAIFKVPSVTLRDATERPETLECGSNMLSGADQTSILRSVKTVLQLHSSASVPVEYLAENVSETVVKILLGYIRP